MVLQAISYLSFDKHLPNIHIAISGEEKQSTPLCPTGIGGHGDASLPWASHLMSLGHHLTWTSLIAPGHSQAPTSGAKGQFRDPGRGGGGFILPRYPNPTATSPSASSSLKPCSAWLWAGSATEDPRMQGIEKEGWQSNINTRIMINTPFFSF